MRRCWGGCAPISMSHMGSEGLMTRHHRRIVDAWSAAIRRAIALGDGESAWRLTIGLVRRLRELGESV